jgi:ATP-dependent Lhr-like helicase
MEILCGKNEFSYINEAAADLLEELRAPYKFRDVTSDERVIWQDMDEMIFETFTGTRIFRTLVWMLRAMGVKVKDYDDLGRISMEKGSFDLDILNRIKTKNWSPKEFIKHTR